MTSPFSRPAITPVKVPNRDDAGESISVVWISSPDSEKH